MGLDTNIKQMKQRYYFWYTFGFYSAIYALLFIISHNKPFFWDKDILDSIQAHWLLDTGFNFNFPNEIDSGHPPLIPFLLAVLWKIVGRHLFVGHLLMFIVSLGTAYQIIRLLKNIMPSNYLLVSSTFVLLDTSLLTQTVVVSGDLLLVFFLFLSINSVLKHKHVLLVLGLSGLCIVNNRGLMSGLIVFGFHLYHLHAHDKNLSIKSVVSIIPLYVIPLLLPIAYFIYHYTVKGWLVYHPDSPWAGCYEIVGLQGFLRNIVIVTWRFLDYGRVFLWLFVAIIVSTKSKLIFRDVHFQKLLVLFILTLIIYVPPMLRYKLLSSHRYLLPSFAVFASISGYLLFTYIKKYKWLVYGVLLAGLLSGNFWVYPEKIAQGWDATLAHLPYYKLKEQLLQYLNENDIPLDKVGTVTPNKSPLKYVHLTNNNVSFSKKNFEKNKFIFYSNIMNDFTDADIDRLNRHWILIQEYEKMGVFIKLYGNPKYIDK